MHIGTMLKRQGKTTNFILITKTVVDDFYGESTIVETEYSCCALVVPARAYDIHSNIFYRPEVTGNEFFGLVDIYVNSEDAVNINEDDFYVNGTKRYKIVAFEYWDKTHSDYVILEGHYEYG